LFSDNGKGGESLNGEGHFKEEDTQDTARKVEGPVWVGGLADVKDALSLVDTGQDDYPALKRMAIKIDQRIQARKITSSRQTQFTTPKASAHVPTTNKAPTSITTQISGFTLSEAMQYPLVDGKLHPDPTG
jgi:hypothetical protein